LSETNVPIKQSAKKYMRASEKRRTQNIKQKKDFREAVKKVHELAKAGNQAEAKETFIVAQKAIDKAAKVGIIKKRAAARKKSRLAKMINKASK
jgi:small subunit ribosomal protein S20